MDKTSKNLLIFLLGLSLLNFLAIILVLNKLPENIPIHWNIDGQIDNWGSRYFILLFAAIPILIPLLMFYLPRFDSKKENYKRMSLLYGSFIINFTLLFIALNWIEVFGALNILNGKAIGIIICLILGLDLMIIGNYMPRIKPNSFLGAKTPWDKNNNYNWRKTQRFSGIIFMFLGALIIVNGFIQNLIFFILSVLIMIASVISIYIYSYKIRGEK